MAKEIPEKDYAKKMRNLKEQTENIIRGLEKGSKSYGKEISEAFQADLKRVGLQEKLETKYSEIEGMSLTPSEKYEALGNYIQTDLDLAKQLLGISGRFGEKEYIAKYGPKSKTLYDKMGKKYNEKVAVMITDMNKEIEHLNSLRLRFMHNKVRAVEKEINLIFSNMVKDATRYSKNAKEYCKKFIQEDIGNLLEGTVDTWLETYGSFSRRKNNVCEALKFIGNTVTKKIINVLAQMAPKKIENENSEKMKKCVYDMHAKYGPMLIGIKKECEELVKEYS